MWTKAHYCPSEASVHMPWTHRKRAQAHVQIRKSSLTTTTNSIENHNGMRSTARTHKHEFINGHSSIVRPENAFHIAICGRRVERTFIVAGIDFTCRLMNSWFQVFVLRATCINPTSSQLETLWSGNVSDTISVHVDVKCETRFLFSIFSSSLATRTTHGTHCSSMAALVRSAISKTSACRRSF